MYKQGKRSMYGHAFPDGLRDNQKLPATILTPTTKADQGDHDAPLERRRGGREEAAVAKSSGTRSRRLR